MKLLVLAALIAAASTGRLKESRGQENQPQSPWQVGKQYRYDVQSYTLAQLQEGASSGNAFKAHFIVRVKAPGHLQARLEQPQHALVHEELSDNKLPANLKYESVENLDKPFEIQLEGGRVQSLKFPSSYSLPHENLLKGLIGALQVDLSTHRSQHSSQDYYDGERQQGTFRKMETDVTGNCDTLYTVSPVAAEWRRELPQFATEEDPIEITKSKDYGHCRHRVAYNFGVPEGAEWTGTSHSHAEQQFIKRSMVTRILASKHGQIYKAETTSTVQVHPHLFGKQKAEVYSHVHFNLVSLEQDAAPEWQLPETQREVKSLLYSMTRKQMPHHDSSESSSSESNEHRENLVVQDQDPKNRQRRSSKVTKVVAISKVIVKRNDKSSDSSSSSDSLSVYNNDETPDINEPAYAALYMTPQAHADNKQNSMNVQKLVQDIAQQLQNPNNMPKADFLSKFNILVRVIASMSNAQLSQTSHSFDAARTSNNNYIKTDMWMIYRDAVAQAGTLPAFQQIKNWIQTKKIKGEEAAQLVATLPNTLRYPTRDILLQFFNLAISKEVQQQRFLNTSALIAATRLINMGQVNNETAHSYYPTHMYGRLTGKHDNFVLEQILPHLSDNLKDAMQRDDSSKAQVYVKAIGNLGHPEILQVFAPYLDGQIKTTVYLRTLIVDNLGVLAYQKNHQTRAVLYSILRNTAESYEVRVAAVRNLFMAHPNAPMMLAMAQMTHNDPSVQVRSILKSGIQSAAQLQHPRYSKLAKVARLAQDMITKEEFGDQQSSYKVFDSYNGEEEENIFNVLAAIGSEDSLYPKQWLYGHRSQKNSWNKPNMISASFSSLSQVMKYYYESTMAASSKSHANHKFSAEKIAQMLNIQNDPQRPLEASVYVNLLDQQRFFSFDENELNQLNENIRKYASEIMEAEKHYTKVFNQGQVSVMFPVAMGMPFIYKYKVPTVIHFQSKGKNQNKNELQKEIQVTYARNIDGNVGFMDTLVNQYASVGVVDKFQLNIPFKITLGLKAKQPNLRLAPLHPDQDTTLLHYSVWPYSASQKKDSLVTISQDKTTKVIERKEKVDATDVKFGQSVGMLFHLQGYSYSQDLSKKITMYSPNEMLTNLAYISKWRDYAMTHYNLRYLKQSQNKAVNFKMAYELYYNQKQNGQLGEPVDTEDTSPNSEARREELVKRVASGINTARVQVVDLSVIFEGPQKAEYVMTSALADSEIDQKVQLAIFAANNSIHGNSQINVVSKLKTPEGNTLNFLDALKRDLKTSFETKIKLGNSGLIRIQGNAQRSQSFTEQLKNSPAGRRCIAQMAQNNLYQADCHKVLLVAHSPDTFEASVNYKVEDIQMIKHIGFLNGEVNSQNTSFEGKIDLKAKAHYQDRKLSWSVQSEYGSIQMKQYIPTWAPYALSSYALFSPMERVMNPNYRHMLKPYCTVDASKIRTFSNRSYDYTLSPAWHVVMHDQVDQRANLYDLVVLARRPNQQQLEVYISYKSEDVHDLEIEIQPAQQGSKKQRVNVKTNGQKVSNGELTMYWDEHAQRPLLDYYSQPDGVLILSIKNNGIRVAYDGQRLVVLAKENRQLTQGICGRMTGEPRDDYRTPNGLVDRPEHYGASYALNEPYSDEKTQQLQSQAKQHAYQPKIKYTSILRSDIEWQNAKDSTLEETSNGEAVYKSRSYSKQRGTCQVQHQVQFYERHGEICITTTPVPACQSFCRGQNYRVQAAQVTCRPKQDQEYVALRDQIRQGQNPEVSGVPQIRQYNVPTDCTA